MTALVFVHGIANGPAHRKLLRGTMLQKLEAAGMKDRFADVVVAEWRSRGAWDTDLADLNWPDGVRAEEAVQDVGDALARTLDAHAKVLVLGHSMGQVLSRLVLSRYAKLDVYGRVALVTAGGPLGNPVYGPALCQLPWSRRCGQPCPVRWVDVWNRDDRICAEKLLGYRAPPHVDATHQISAPGTPSLLDNVGEHGAYFDRPEFWKIVGDEATKLDGGGS